MSEMAKSDPPANPFKEFIFTAFIEWEKAQPNQRSNFSAFARWLSDNKYGVTFKQQLISDWVKGRYAPKDELYILVLAEKLGKIVYEVLDIDPINPLRIFVLRNWDKAPKKLQIELAKLLSKYTTDPLPDELQENTSTKSK
jgi:hypothetical protein